MFRNVLLPLSRSSLQLTFARNVARKRVPKVDKKLQAQQESLAARGFLRPNKPYTPTENVEETIKQICANHGLDPSSEFSGLDVKFAVLNACFKETGHSVPNSLLHSIECVDDLLMFYATPVDTRTPFDALKSMDLPKNLHIQEDYVRFHPDKDPLFGGKTAFPKSSTIVSGIKTRKKYEGHVAKRSWPYKFNVFDCKKCMYF